MSAMRLPEFPADRPPTEAAAEARFVRSLFLGALVCRLLLSLVLAATDMRYYFAWDAYRYDQLGLQLARHWSGEVAWVSPELTWFTHPQSHYRGFLYLLAALYYLLGHSPLIAQSVICLAGAYTAVVVYKLTATLYGSNAARHAALLTAYFPSLILWSSHLLRDPLIVLLIALTIYHFVRLTDAFRLQDLAFFVASLLCLHPMRSYVFYIMAASSLTWFAVASRGNVLRGLLVQIGAVAAFVALFAAFGWDSVLRSHFEQDILEQLQVTRSDLAMSGESGFARDLDVSTPMGAFRALPIGLTYLLLAPFPWHMLNFRQLMTLPEMLVWWALIPTMLVGLRHAVRKNFRQALPILSFLVGLSLMYALFQGNLGTAYRQRSQLLVLFFVFAGAGLALRRERREQAAVLSPLAGETT
jgi:hypothetical protein